MSNSASSQIAVIGIDIGKNSFHIVGGVRLPALTAWTGAPKTPHKPHRADLRGSGTYVGRGRGSSNAAPLRSDRSSTDSR